MPGVRSCFRCVICALHQTLKAIDTAGLPEPEAEDTFRSALRLLSELDYSLSPPELTWRTWLVVKNKIKGVDPYREEKKRSFELAEKVLAQVLREAPEDSTEKLHFLARLCVAANTVDFGIPEYGLSKFVETVERALREPFAVDDFERLLKDLEVAKTLLWLADNMGEASFDRAFLEEIKRLFPQINVKIVVRAGPILNDVTLEDAGAVGFAKLGEVLSQGTDAPGFLIESAPKGVRDLFYNADVVISKGQGNIEAIFGARTPIYYLLAIKCEHLANLLGLKKGDLVILRG